MHSIVQAAQKRDQPRGTWRCRRSVTIGESQSNDWHRVTCAYGVALPPWAPYSTNGQNVSVPAGGAGAAWELSVMLLRTVHELSYGEIASTLGLREEVVRRYLYTAWMQWEGCNGTGAEIRVCWRKGEQSEESKPRLIQTATQTRLRPSCLAVYRARSARCMRDSKLSSPLATATPTERVIEPG